MQAKEVDGVYVGCLGSGIQNPLSIVEIPRQTLGYLLILFGLKGHIIDPARER